MKAHIETDEQYTARVKNLEFNKKLKEKLEKDFGKEFVNDKIIIMGLDDE